MMKKCKYHCDYGDGEFCYYDGKADCVHNEIKQELKPCPFCGGPAEIHQIPKDVPEDIRSGMWVVGCDGLNGSLCPGYRYKLSPFYTAEELAIKMWNERN